MKQVVKAVETGLDDTSKARPILVRIKLRPWSHLMVEHDLSTLRATFQLAARGTRAEGAELEVVEFAGEAWCPRCQWDGTAQGEAPLCPRCGGPALTGQEAPELVVHELVVEDTT
ncbi:MAG: hydrogenase maturation nickel metallochaperone HypA [Nitrospira sp.]|nr:hydrogenase maturation nickel metallochaperone HypA [Nitrospira sp.]